MAAHKLSFLTVFTLCVFAAIYSTTGNIRADVHYSNKMYMDGKGDPLEICSDPEGLYPHYNCTLYYQCENGIPLVRPCNDGLYFNEEKDECDRPENVQACEGGTRQTLPYTGPTTTMRPICPPIGVHYLEKYGTCFEYIMCINGTPWTLKCSTDQHFDPSEKMCVHKSQYKCPYGSRKF